MSFGEAFDEEQLHNGIAPGRVLQCALWTIASGTEMFLNNL